MTRIAGDVGQREFAQGSLHFPLVQPDRQRPGWLPQQILAQLDGLIHLLECLIDRPMPQAEADPAPAEPSARSAFQRSPASRSINTPSESIARLQVVLQISQPGRKRLTFVARQHDGLGSVLCLSPLNRERDFPSAVRWLVLFFALRRSAAARADWAIQRVRPGHGGQAIQGVIQGSGQAIQGVRPGHPGGQANPRVIQRVSPGFIQRVRPGFKFPAIQRVRPGFRPSRGSSRGSGQVIQRVRPGFKFPAILQSPEGQARFEFPAILRGSGQVSSIQSPEGQARFQVSRGSGQGHPGGQARFRFSGHPGFIQGVRPSFKFFLAIQSRGSLAIQGVRPGFKFFLAIQVSSTSEGGQARCSSFFLAIQVSSRGSGQVSSFSFALLSRGSGQVSSFFWPSRSHPGGQAKFLVFLLPSCGEYVALEGMSRRLRLQYPGHPGGHGQVSS